jgi:hypothetical protein
VQAKGRCTPAAEDCKYGMRFDTEPTAGANCVKIIHDNVEIQENLCFVGGIPIISKFALNTYPGEIRLEAAAFVRQMYQGSTLTLQMFIGCGGLNVLVEFLEEDLETERDLVLIGVNGVGNVFGLQACYPIALSNRSQLTFVRVQLQRTIFAVFSPAARFYIPSRLF